MSRVHSKNVSGKVRPKKSLGQHFLHDHHIAQKIVDSLYTTDNTSVLEIGPGTGVLTQFLMNRSGVDLKLVEIDRESVSYLKEHYPALEHKIIEGDFLSLKLDEIFDKKFSIIGNFPYNISSQIFFKILAYRYQVDQVVCMLQKEVADRIAEKEGSKTYGILSVLLQAYYNVKYLFKVSPGVFIPPPKVMSAVIRLERNDVAHLPCDEKLFFQVVKQGFNNRRKTLRNALKPLGLDESITSLPIFDKRAEQLSVQDFVSLTGIIQESRAGTSN